MDEINTQIQGTWEYRARHLVVKGALIAGVHLSVLREPRNPYDKNAIAVYYLNDKLGYVPRNLAARIAPYLDSSGCTEAKISAIGEREHRGKRYPTVSVRFRFRSLTPPDGLAELIQQSIEHSEVSGVYAITSSDTGQAYVGSSTDIGARLRKHVDDLRAGLHSNTGLSQAWLRHGPSGFLFSLLERVASEDLAARERFHIQKLKSYVNGYNQTSSGQGHFPLPKTQEAQQLREKMKEDYVSRHTVTAPRVSSSPSPSSSQGRGCVLLLAAITLLAMAIAIWPALFR